jgi:hypothetical protein
MPEVNIFSRSFAGNDKSLFLLRPAVELAKVTVALSVAHQNASCDSLRSSNSRPLGCRPVRGLCRRQIASVTRKQYCARENTAPAWVSEPQYRGTASILYSCIITLILCVYLALRPNVPAYRESRLTTYSRAVKWAFKALIAPEVVLLSAYFQYYGAKTLVAKLEHIRSRRVSKPTEQPTTSLETANKDHKVLVHAVYS